MEKLSTKKEIEEAQAKREENKVGVSVKMYPSEAKQLKTLSKRYNQAQGDVIAMALIEYEKIRG